MTGIVRDVDAFDHSANAKRTWRPSAFNPSGSAKAWASDGVVIVTARNGAGLLTFKIKFRNGKTCHQPTLSEAEEYAEAHDAKNRR